MSLEEKQHKINLLPEHLIDQIKAGEVIERPASLVKELLENSLDANSTNIKISIIENGLELISIEDNGDGILFEDLPYAFCRHATSKIERFEDIYNLYSFGFRGEALASMAAISRITCSSTPIDNPEQGGKIVIHGAKEMSHTPLASRKQGTSIFIKDLFFNTPARLKFIKSKTSEKNAIKRVINAFILTNPKVQFSVKWDDKDKNIFKPVEDTRLADRIREIILPKNSPNKELYEFEGEYEGHSVRGFASAHTSKGNAGKSQYLFVNGRLFTDRQIHQSILRTMEKVWPFGETGHYCVMLNVPPTQVDVNVHPNKTQVKFFKANIVFSLVSASIKKFIEENFKEEVAPQNELFNRDQAKEQSVQMFSQSPFSTYSEQSNHPVSYGPSSRVLPTLSNTESATFLSRLNERYLLLTDENSKKFMIDSFALFIQYWIDNWKENYPYDEAKTTPLLISEPFQLHQGIDKLANFLKTLGLELDKLDESTYALRTIPNCFDSFNIREVLSDILTIFQQSSLNPDNFEKVLNETIKDFNPSQFFLSDYAINYILQRYTLAQALNSKAIVNLDNEALEKLFK
ncbi:putative DNA mismatch repair protein [Halobacteriovorax marinus SJ]|uniref:DNA mismatch repair protein MutL n=1 Tax=Halobacteriovorax marinus (strain ATCC BAA-682 / DSM 15412 / SJ) TaxID=862908 RepID=E1WXL2_HALMS|nr:DNA mismatch repair endonuclease MutL [Halobacteriovorax marinus]CBW27530.1 putative DNA mismatch repair protein [Halobacteriovorax marinus SJ]